MSFFHPKAKCWIEGRRNWDRKLKFKIGNEKNWIWFHCASVGEFEDSKIVFSKIIELNKKAKFILTFSSPTGYEHLKDSKEYDLIFYLPLDTKTNANKYLDILQPKQIYFSRSELWYNYLTQIQRRNIPIFLISLKLSSKSNFLKWPLSLIYQKCFISFNMIFCQDKLTSNLLFEKHKIKSTLVTGNTRIEQILNELNKNIEIEHISHFVGVDKCIVVGSCLPRDEKYILKIINKETFKQYKWIIVPHEINQSYFNKIPTEIKNIALKYSTINDLTLNHSVLIIDHVGSLKHIYKYGHVAIIGGGFNRIGIHNVIEPAVYRVHSLIGPNDRNYLESFDLKKMGMVSVFQNEFELEKLIHFNINKIKSDNVELDEYFRINSNRSSEVLTEILNHITPIN